MSITFTIDLPRPGGTRIAPCLCAQLTDGFDAMMRGDDDPKIRGDLAAGANPDCPSCRGSGVETVRVEHAFALNLANDNALRFLALLGLPVACTGECTIAEARRALVRARNVSAEQYVRDDEVVHCARRREDGAVEMRAVRIWSRGLSAERLLGYTERLEILVQHAVEAEAVKIIWG